MRAHQAVAPWLIDSRLYLITSFFQLGFELIQECRGMRVDVRLNRGKEMSAHFKEIINLNDFLEMIFSVYCMIFLIK